MAQPGARALLAYLLEAWPLGWSMGIYNCREIRGDTSLSIHACGRAVDFALPMVGGRGSLQGYEIVRALGNHGKRLGVQFIIFDRMEWGARVPRGGTYLGVHPHFDHLHIELTPKSALSLNLTTLRTVLGDRRHVEDDVYVIKFGTGSVTNPDARVRRAQRVIGAYQLLKNQTPIKADGAYGNLTRDAINWASRNANLPPMGHEGLDVLLLDYIRGQIEGRRKTTGLTQAQADEQFIKKGTEIELRARLG
jgi:hypothetical protein